MHIDEPKVWNNKCPLCGAKIRWRLTSSEPDAESTAYCANGTYASRISIKNLKSIKFCFWAGKVVRQKDGGIRFKNLDGAWI